MFVVPFALFILGKGRGYYMAAGYPILYAGGAVLLAAWLSHLARPWRMLTSGVGWAALAANIILFGALFLPIAPVNSPWWHRMTATNDDVKEEMGWREFVETVAQSAMRFHRKIAHECASWPAITEKQARLICMGRLWDCRR